MTRLNAFWGIILCFMMLAIPSVLAFSLTSTEDFIKDETTSEYGKYQIYEKDLFLFKGDLKYEVDLNQNTKNCGGGDICYAYFNSNLLKDGTLVDKWNIYNLQTMKPDTMRWMRLEYYGDVIDYETQCEKGKTFIDEKNGTEYTEEICNQVEVGSHKDWIEFKEGEILKADYYTWRALGDKAPWKDIEWTFTKEDIETWEWAVWGGVIGVGGVTANVTLNNPTNNSIIYTNPVTTNYSMNITGGAYLTNTTGYIWYANGSLFVSNFSNITLPENHLISYYKLDETSGNITDAFGLNNLIVAGSPTYGQSGVINNSILFGNEASAISGVVSGLSTLTSATKTGTFNIWWKATSTANDYQSIFHLGEDGNSNSISVNVIKSTGYILYAVSEASYEVINTGDLTDGNWKMITLVINNGVPMFYVNGVFKANATIGDAGAFTTAKIRIGNTGLYSTANNNENVDEFGIWNKSLTASEITALYNSGSGYRPSLSITNYIQTFTNTLPVGNYKYNGKGCDSDGACGFAPQNFTFSIDSQAPTIIINSGNGTQNYGRLTQNHTINFTATDTNLDKVWFNYNGTNTTITGAVSGVMNSTNFTLVKDLYNTTIYANDTAGNLKSEVVSWDYKVFENSRSSNATSYETAYETYSINVTADNSLTGVFLNYNGTEYQTVNTAATIWSYSRDLPTSSVGNNSITYRFVYSGTNISSSTTYQNVLNTVFQICNATYPTQFINFTFKDENTLASINATIQTATWDYYLGTGTQYKSYVYTTSENSSNYTFCATPNRTLYASPSITYVGSTYPARFYTPGILTLSNLTTSTTLYLLSSTDGIYVTFLTIGESNIALSGALVNIFRTISGSTVNIGQGLTDSAGSYTIWLNPNYDHTIVASKTGYGTNTQTIRPTQSSYTLVLSSGANYTYVSNVKGLLWSYFPRNRLTTNATNFGFNVSSLYSSLVKCKIELLNNNKSTILSTAETITANGSFCSVQTTYVPSTSNPQIKGRLLIDIGDGYQILEEDAYWILLDYNTTGMTFTDWFTGLTDADLRYFNEDSQHREYTYILLFFLIVMIICATLNNAGWDIQTNGGMIYVVGALVWIASVPGFLTLANISPYNIIDKYFIAVVFSMFMIGFGARSYN
jgi:hypothetical protein